MKMYNIILYKGIGNDREFIGYLADINGEIAEVSEKDARRFIEKITNADQTICTSIVTEEFGNEIYSFTAHQKENIYFVATGIR